MFGGKGGGRKGLAPKTNDKVRTWGGGASSQSERDRQQESGVRISHMPHEKSMLYQENEVPNSVLHGGGQRRTQSGGSQRKGDEPKA